ncbi:TetR/AcrR family transcriptional regulator [Chelatococcus sp. YT9]|uniref:TetR/AcrR family transcriptional regulator n=1 Tax=Chelatococcus sp. YT9 TaxID=2835635 RepID=UPI001BD0D899|nr:TetR/AcrR family transcriptional regulator [Chelatococcus sp. YT9]MBS7701344.1 TetR/AcrR family transcriptional regulator [Chelatococcus sp. YT9]
MGTAAVCLPPPASTRSRILNAAIKRFARFSYEETGLRDIADDVGVDVAYVHRSFGSKERLFAEAVRATAQAERISALGEANFPSELAREFLAEDPETEHGVRPLDISVRSLSSASAASVLREFILNDVIVPLNEKIQPPDLRRAALVAALLAGLGILKDVLKIDPLVNDDEGELEPLIRDAIAAIIKHPTGS